MNTTNFSADLRSLRSQAPLVYHITNVVAVDFSANALLAIGASPVMSQAIEEVEDLSAAAGVLVLNIGTVDAAQLQLMLAVGQVMRRLGKPIVLDPVGAGASVYRTKAAWRIIRDCHPTIIRGNASEIKALAINSSLVQAHHSINSSLAQRAINSSFPKGVDSTIRAVEAVDAAQALAHETGAVVVISGETDYVTDGKRVETVVGGSVLQTRVTAMGCAATSVVAAFAAVTNDAFRAAIDGMTAMSIAGERAAQKAKGTGSMRTLFLDELYGL